MAKRRKKRKKRPGRDVERVRRTLDAQGQGHTSGVEINLEDLQKIRRERKQLSETIPVADQEVLHKMVERMNIDEVREVSAMDKEALITWMMEHGLKKLGWEPETMVEDVERVSRAGRFFALLLVETDLEVQAHHDAAKATGAATRLMGVPKTPGETDASFARWREELARHTDDEDLDDEAVEARMRELFGDDAYEDLIGKLFKYAKALSLKDFLWLSDLSGKWRSGEITEVSVGRAIEDRFKSDEARFQATQMIVKGTPGGEVLDTSIMDRLNPADRRWVQNQLAQVATPMVIDYARGHDGAKKADKAARQFMRRMAREIPRHISYLDQADSQSLLDYFRLALQDWMNNAVRHVENIRRMVDTIPADEVELITTLYFHHRESENDYLATVGQWYMHCDSETKSVCIKVAMDIRSAVEALGSELFVALRRQFSGEGPSRKPGRAAVRHYLQILGEAYETASTQDDNRSARLLWAALRNARVFEIASDTYHGIAEEVRRYVIEKVAEVPIEALDGDGPYIKEGALTDEEQIEASRRIAEQGMLMPLFDDILPFDHTFIGIDGPDGNGFSMSVDGIGPKLVEPPEGMIACRLLGYLIGPIHGSQVEVIEYLRITATGGVDYIVPVGERVSMAQGTLLDSDSEDVAWLHPRHLSPWIVNALIGFIHEHSTLILESRMAKSDRKKVSKLARETGEVIIPKPYYLVPMKRMVVKDAVRRSVGLVRKRAPLTYRHDRRGHPRVYIQRGPLPLDDKKRKQLEKPKGNPPLAYKIFTVNNPDAETARYMMHRRVPPKRADEWLAVKVRFIGHQVIGDESLPYVPGVRRSTDPQVRRQARKNAEDLLTRPPKTGTA